VTVVVDASVAVKWVLSEEGSEDALDLRDYWRDTGETVVAPPIFAAEVTNVLYQRVRRREIGEADALAMLELLLLAVVVREPPDLYGKVVRLANELSLTATYDALYLGTAESERCEVWTADKRLVNSVRPWFPLVRLVGEQP
jgi:predicted nucleic acid-binding protein